MPGRTIVMLMLSALVFPGDVLAQNEEAPLPPTQDPVAFPAAGEDAPMLEGELSVPQRPNSRARVPGVVICHPNPLMGGTMHNNVVLAMRDRCLKLGMATLIFNFRGVGRSEGRRADSVECVEDVLGALAFLRAQPAVDPRRCGLAGYSFGSAMALRACARDKTILACAAVGFPTGLEEPVKLDDFAYLEGLKLPVLFVTGTEDQYSSLPNITRLVAEYELQARVLPLEGVDHFFAQPERLAMMAAQVAQFLAGKLIGEL